MVNSSTFAGGGDKERGRVMPRSLLALSSRCRFSAKTKICMRHTVGIKTRRSPDSVPIGARWHHGIELGDGTSTVRRERGVYALFFSGRTSLPSTPHINPFIIVLDGPIHFALPCFTSHSFTNPSNTSQWWNKRLSDKAGWCRRQQWCCWGSDMKLWYNFSHKGDGITVI